MNEVPELEAAQQWVEDNVNITTRRQGGTLHVEATTMFNIPAETCWNMIAHPDNCEVFRNIQRCTYRKVLWNGPREGHHQLVVVENESDWSFLVIKGALATKLLVEVDSNKGLMHFTLAPDSPSPMRELYGRWTIAPAGPLQMMSDGTTSSPCCTLTLYQRFTPRNLPPFLFHLFARFTAGQIRNTFEDVLMEVQRIQSGSPTLGPYSTAAMKEISPPSPTSSDPAAEGQHHSHRHKHGHADSPDADTVLAILEEASNASCSANDDDRLLHRRQSSSYNGSGSSRSSGASMASSSRSEPSSHALKWRNASKPAAWSGNEEKEEDTIPGSHNKNNSLSYYDRASSLVTSAKDTLRAARRWIDEHMPLDDDAFESAWNSAFGDDFGKGLWLVVA
ncbi:hypothetical protein Ndes2526B_g04544 [Nannochloris sp. 'desiccata']|nr:hypothetical protein NADE_003236 [Chlorella desiccata (nom. nud.)]